MRRAFCRSVCRSARNSRRSERLSLLLDCNCWSRWLPSVVPTAWGSESGVWRRSAPVCWRRSIRVAARSAWRARLLVGVAIRGAARDGDAIRGAVRAGAAIRGDATLGGAILVGAPILAGALIRGAAWDAAGVDLAAGAPRFSGAAVAAPPAKAVARAIARAMARTSAAFPAINRDISLNSHVAANENASAMDLVPLAIISWHRSSMNWAIGTW